MNLDTKTIKKDPPKEEINHIIELFNSNKFVDAKKEIDKKILNYPNSPILFNILGAILASQGQLDKAVESYRKAIKFNSNYAQAYNNLGIALHRLNKINEAIDNYKKALNIKNDFAEVFNNLGNAMRELGKTQDSLQYFEKAIQIKFDYVEAHNSLGCSYHDLGKRKEALDNFQKAIEIKPNFADTYTNLGILFSDMDRFDEAIASFNKAIQLKPDSEKSYNNLGNLFNNFGKYDKATTAYYQAIKIKPDYATAYSNLLFNLSYKVNFDPFLYLKEAKKFRSNCKIIKKKLTLQYQYQKKPKNLRLGLVSSDFGNHPGGYFSLSTLQELKKKNFELVAYSNFDRKDEFSHHFKTLFLNWNSIKKKKDDEVVEKIVKDGIHILIDLQGHSSQNRLPVFMYKPAPVQATWLGQGSTGIPEIDYFIGSPHTTPKEDEKHFIEKILRLPEISQCFTPPDFDVSIKNLPAIKNKFITFGNLNKLSKVNNTVISLWSKILSSVKNSKLILKSRELDSQKILNDTYEKFNKYNIDKNKLILLGKSKTRKELLETYNQIDIALDPFPFQGNTTTCEAAWMGVPTITLKGNRYLFHFGESINSNLKMLDWIAQTQNEYIDKAIMFSTNIDKLSSIRHGLHKRALESPAFNAPRFAEHFSEMLWGIWKKFNDQ